MPFDARVFQIFIASPGDVSEERGIATEVIQRWNDLNAREKSLVSLPLRWETHSSPELGARPQAVINRQVLEQCDLLIGIFWTRLGTPTGESQSGTVEEIEQAGKSGKPIMLYFSNAMVNPDTIDLDEYRRLKEFRNKTYPQGLVETYGSLTEFRDKLSGQLSIKVRDLVAHDNGAGSPRSAKEKVDVSLALALEPPSRLSDFFHSQEEHRGGHGSDQISGRSLQSSGKIVLEVILCSNYGEIPDYGNPKKISLSAFNAGIFPERPDYYREMVQFYITHKRYCGCRLAVINHSIIGIPEIAVESVLYNDHGLIEVTDTLPRRPTKTDSVVLTSPVFFDREAVLRVKKDHCEWQLSMDLRVVQAKRTVASRNKFFLGATSNTSVRLQTTLYSTAMPPVVLENTFDIELSERIMTYQDILEELGVR
jgi:hypothetical protein